MAIRVFRYNWLMHRSLQQGINPSIGKVMMLASLVLPAVLARFYLLYLNPPLWLDEAMLGLNIRERGLVELTYPLMYDHGAPFGYLWLLKGMTLIFGENEFALRVPSLIASGVSLWLLANLASKIQGVAGRWFAVAAIAFSYPAISYSVQAKQYSLDMMITLALWLLAWRIFDNNKGGDGLGWLGWAGALAIWFSHPAVFTLAGIGVALLVFRYRFLNIHTRQQVWLAFGTWAVSFLALLMLQYRSLGNNNNLTAYWQEYFMPIGAGLPGWLFARLAELVRNPGGIWYWVPDWLTVTLVIIGATALAARKNWWAVAFLVTMVATLGASALRMYPFGGRLGLFLTPGLMILIGASLDLFVLALRRWQRVGLVLALFAAVALLYGGAKFSLENVISPKQTENIRPVMEAASHGYRAGDMIYLYHFSAPVFAYYAGEYGLADATTTVGENLPAGTGGYNSEGDKVAGYQRVWVMFSHLVDERYLAQRDEILQEMSTQGKLRKSITPKGTATELHLYDITQK